MGTAMVARLYSLEGEEGGGGKGTVLEKLRNSKQLLLTQRLASIRNRLLPFACSRTDPFSLAR